MKILLIAPEPFYQERGTPIAIRMACETLSKRKDVELELLCYQEGARLEIPNLLIRRIKSPAWLSGIRPGISVKKIISDIFIFCAAIKLAIKNRHKRYTFIHAVEESVFIAWILKCIFGIPYVYDMDSSLSLQLTSRWKCFKPILSLLSFFESIAVRNSYAVIAICQSLAESASSYGAKDVSILSDVSLLELHRDKKQEIDIKSEIGISESTPLLMYVGNLEPYQGIDLLLESFALASTKEPNSHLVIVGGRKDHISAYKSKAESLDISKRVHFVGPKAVETLSSLFAQADILLSPRIEGENTPMKIYSYLDGGKALLATKLPTHLQVLNDSLAVLVEANPTAFGDGMLRLLSDEKLRRDLGARAKAYAQEHFTLESFQKKLNGIYDGILERG